MLKYKEGEKKKKKIRSEKIWWKMLSKEKKATVKREDEN